MGRLGYDRYFAQGGDKGTLVSLLLGANFPERVAAIHLNLMPVIPPACADPTAGLDAEDLGFLETNAAFAAAGAGY